MSYGFVSLQEDTCIYDHEMFNCPIRFNQWHIKQDPQYNSNYTLGRGGGARESPCCISNIGKRYICRHVEIK